MEIKVQAEKAEKLRKLHHGPRVLALPNAWDVVSARILEEVGHPAIATSSAAVAFSLGYPDGQRISGREMLDAVARISRAVRVPVTADLESGYGKTPEEIADFTKAMVASGAVGLNFEDVTGDDESTHVELELQVKKIHAIRETAAAMGVPIVINARTDVYLMPIGPEATRFERTVERLRAYRNAGADCLFVPGLCDREIIAKLVKALDAPLNILASPGCPSLDELEKIGVARVSAGSSAMRAAMGAFQRVAKDWLAHGSYDSLHQVTIPYAELNQMMVRRLS
ncbi:MAG TPA: isocitrate lyase/phosphoenolpyruvate mutase family protein [Candidatus Acidoferrum sp.]|jgi:2-methylisocitrate lyase-like PEP mutase family enzyme|nr:isocitrate lyase/phosphoenolpyruvate mutase family protein [Candidatus Acidoferrum sp.]